MNKNEFMNIFENSLGNMPQMEKKDILYDYHEHFNIGLEQGKTEEMIAQSLGDPKVIARQFKADYAFKQAEETKSAGNILKAVFATISLGFFNLVFVLGPFLGLIGVLLGLYASAVGFILSGVLTVFAVMFENMLPSFVNIGVNAGTGFFMGIGLVSLGLLFMIGNYYLTKLFYNGTMKYLKMNLRIIKR